MKFILKLLGQFVISEEVSKIYSKNIWNLNLFGLRFIYVLNLLERYGAAFTGKRQMSDSSWQFFELGSVSR